jgi:mutator protein MutT
MDLRKIFETIRNTFLALEKKITQTEEIEIAVEDKDKKEIWYKEEKDAIKYLFDNDLMDEEEYIEKLKIINSRIKEAKNNSEGVQDYADAIIRNGKGDILFLRRSSNDEFFPGYWCLPGGKIEVGETAEEAIKREVAEETNKNVLETFLIAKKRLSNGATIHLFECITNNIDGDILLNIDEHYSYQFINKYDYDKYNFILDLKNILIQIDEKFKPKEDDVQIVKSEQEVIHINGIEFITEDKDKKYTSLKKLVDEGQVDENYFMHYLQTINSLPEAVNPSKFEPANQTQLSETRSKEEEEKRAEKTDLITLPENVTGTNCGNCMFYNKDNCQCVNKEVDQKVTDNMCCALWDNEEVKRPWKQDNKIGEEVKL